MSVRAVTAADVPLLAILHASSFAEAWDEKALRDLLASPGTVGLIADFGAGFILIRAVADEAEVLTICVANAARRQGVGAALLCAGASKAAQMGAKSVFLEVVVDNGPAKALYNRHGFRTVGTRHAYYQGRDALILRADIPLALPVGNAGKTL